MVLKQLNHYKILRPLGKGGMGEVYLAEDTRLNRKVALKILPSEMSADADRRARLHREAKAVAALNHPNIVTIFSIEESNGVLFLTMELVEGQVLADGIPSGGFAPKRLFEVAVPLADALSAAHDGGVTHRDLKPQNIMVTNEGRVKVLDFGLAKLRNPVSETDLTQSAIEIKTEEGYLLGTLRYVAPEQLQGKAADNRSDIFSLGIVLYLLCTARHPFRGETPAELVSSVLRDEPRPIADLRPDLPRHLGRIIRRCLEKDPRRRYQATLDLRNELEDLQAETAADRISEIDTSGPKPGPSQEMFHEEAEYVRAASLAEVRATGSKVVQVTGHSVALFWHRDKVHAVDNRCPHMGFPLDRGSVKDCILTCHWHHARFDLTTGGTFDPWADDVRVFPVEIRDSEIWVDVARHRDILAYHRRRVSDGLERNIPLVIAKSVIALLDQGDEPEEAFRTGLAFGVRYRRDGWSQGLTILTCMMNLLRRVDPQDRPRALYQGLSAVAVDCDGEPPRFGLRPLPGAPPDLATMKGWFRRFVEVRDEEGAERCIVTAVRIGATHRQLADMLFAASTDHRYIQTGHALDFTNKAFEALDGSSWELAEPVLASLAHGYAAAARMEESNAWRHPVDLIPILDRAFDALSTALEIGQGRRGSWTGGDGLLQLVLADDPQAIADALLTALRQGATEEELAGVVAYAAALRIARFHTSNEFGDWDTALHTFTFANAVHQGVRRSPSPELMRGVFDAAMSVYLDRFLNVPASPLPETAGEAKDSIALAQELPSLLDRQQQVDAAGELVANYLYQGGEPRGAMAILGRVLVREDRNFHTIQAVEAAFRQCEATGSKPAATHLLVAAARYLAAHSPTVRAQGQTYQIAHRLHRGERLYES